MTISPFSLNIIDGLSYLILVFPKCFYWHFHFILPLLSGVVSFLPDIEGFEFKFLRLFLLSGVVHSCNIFETIFLLTYFTVLATISFSSWPSVGQFLVPWNRTRPAPLPRAVNQVNFIAFTSDCTTLHKFISCVGPCRGPTYRFYFIFTF